MTRVYLVRHAESAWTPDDMRPLTPRGCEQAEGVADRLAPLQPSAIYASPYTRARQTVDPLARRLGLDIVTIDDFRERRLEASGADAFDAESRASWDDFSRALSGSESNAEAQRRGLAALAPIVERHRGGAIVVATHGTLLALMLNGLDPRFDFAFWRALTTPDVYEVRLPVSGPVTIGRLQIG